jgi:hypothetical protein
MRTLEELSSLDATGVVDGEVRGGRRHRLDLKPPRVLFMAMAGGRG